MHAHKILFFNLWFCIFYITLLSMTSLIHINLSEKKQTSLRLVAGWLLPKIYMTNLVRLYGVCYTYTLSPAHKCCTRATFFYQHFRLIKIMFSNVHNPSQTPTILQIIIKRYQRVMELSWLELSRFQVIFGLILNPPPLWLIRTK